jgi:putative transposase
MQKNSTKSANQYRIPSRLWKLLKKHLPKPPKIRGRGRPPVANRNVMNGIWHVLWTGCQWKSIHKEWFAVSSSVLHERFQTWQERGIFEKLFKTIIKYYAREKHIHWRWQSVDSMMSPAPLGGTQTGRNPTDRGKSGSKIHLLVDELGAPLAIWITGANEHDKWSVDDLIVHIVTKRPYSEQHFCADRGYDFVDVHEMVSLSFILNISNTSENAMNQTLNVQSRVRKLFQHTAGSSSELLVGWQNGEVSLRGGARSLRTGSLLFTWLVRK